MDRNLKELLKRVHSENEKKLLVVWKELYKLDSKMITTPAHSPVYIVVTKGMNKTLMDKARILINEARLPQRCWLGSVLAIVDALQ